MVSNFSVALASHGLQPVDEHAGPADLTVVMRYEQENLSLDRTTDDFEERIAMGDSQRFVAKIITEIHETGANKLVWSGQLQRIHDVAPGEYMHTGKASEPCWRHSPECSKIFHKSKRLWTHVKKSPKVNGTPRRRQRQDDHAVPDQALCPSGQ